MFGSFAAGWDWLSTQNGILKSFDCGEKEKKTEWKLEEMISIFDEKIKQKINGKENLTRNSEKANSS